MARVVRLHPHVIMVGLDHHEGLYYMALLFGNLAPLGAPYIPVPTVAAYQTIHLAGVPVDWSARKDKTNKTVLADGAQIVSSDHTAQRVPHIPPGINVLVPVVILLGEANWKLAVSSVLAVNGPLASTALGPMGFTLNCADPISMPCGVYPSPGTVHVSPTAADYGLLLLEWAASEALNLVVACLGGKAASRAGGAKAWVYRRTYVESRYTRDASRVADKALMTLFRRRFIVEGAGDLLRGGSQKAAEKFAGDGSKDLLDGWGIGPGTLAKNEEKRRRDRK